VRTEELIGELDKMLGEGWNLPLSGGKVVMDAPQARRVLKGIMNSLPEEVRQAKAIAKDRGEIIKRASKDAKLIIRSAEEKAKKIVEQDELVIRAKERARAVEEKAKEEAQLLREAAKKYVCELFKKTDEILSLTLKEFRNHVSKRG
jgi:vacuolar-type H+-ATPase subunit H